MDKLAQLGNQEKIKLLQPVKCTHAQMSTRLLLCMCVAFYMHTVHLGIKVMFS